MDRGAIFIFVSLGLLFLFILGLIMHQAIRDKRESVKKLERKMAVANYVDEVERAMREGKKLTDPEAVRRFHRALDARRADRDEQRNR